VLLWLIVLYVVALSGEVLCVVSVVWWSESSDVFMSESSVRASVVSVCVGEMSLSLPSSALNEVVSSMGVLCPLVGWVLLACFC
jgi:hypothetical protein